MIFNYLIGSVIDIAHVTGHLSHTGKERDGHESIICPNGIFMGPDTGNSTVRQTGFTIVQVFCSFVDIIQKSTIRMLHLQVNQAGPHRSVVVQTLSTKYHVPTQFANSIPAFVFHGPVILLLEELQITVIEYEVHILENIIVVFLGTGLIRQFH